MSIDEIQCSRQWVAEQVIVEMKNNGSSECRLVLKIWSAICGAANKLGLQSNNAKIFITRRGTTAGLKHLG